MNICKICNKEIPKKRAYCSNKCKFSDHEYNQRRNHNLKNDETTICVCLKTEKEFTDHLNLSGILTKHIKNEYGIKYDSLNFNDYFKTKKVVKKEYFECPYCGWKTIDIKNKSGCITNHLKSKHDKSMVEFFLEYPAYQSKFGKMVQLESKRKNHLLTPINRVTCKICGESMKILSNSHLKKHNITQEKYKLKYSDIISNTTHEQFSNTLSMASEKIKHTSNGQTEVTKFLKNLGINNIKENTKRVINPFELDIYLPDYQLAIEYNGLYWHTDRIVDKTYHLTKTKKCEELGIQLIHIFEDEWIENQKIIKSIIKAKLGIFDKKIFARKCNIVEITKEQKKVFLNDNHRQGNDKSQIFYGLEYKNEIISVITFSTPRIALGNKSKQNHFELSRFCTKVNYQCVGALSKLLSHFDKLHNFDSLISYADRRFSSSSKTMYSSTGFKLISETKPNYFYLKNNKRLHRFNFTKQKLIENYGGDPNKTEFEIANELGLYRIWDCGSIKYEYVPKK